MKALIRSVKQTSLTNTSKPELTSDRQVLIQVCSAAICRTDVRVAMGEIGERFPITLGHEFAGIVAAVGSNVSRVKVGDRVTVMPIFPCNTCSACKRNQQCACERSTMLGLDLDGAFAEYVAVPEYSVYSIPDELDFQQAAYAEPVAASLAVAKSGITTNEKGLIFGANRIAELTKRILLNLGFSDVQVISKEEAKSLDNSSFDYVIETLADTESFSQIIDLVRPQGRIVLKSRQFKPLSLSLQRLVKKELTLSAVSYGSFQQAVELISQCGLELETLIGETYALNDFEKAFKESLNSESKKIYFDPRA